MRRAYALLCFVAFVSLCVEARGQTNLATDEALIQRILAGDIHAIAQAGASGNKAFIPYLRRELNDQRNKNSNLSPIPWSRIALAKLGELDQLQEMWCICITEDPDSGIGPPVQDFVNLGGWYAYQALQKFLLPEGDIHFNRAYKKYLAKYPHDIDFSYEPPSYYAIKALTEITPEPPARWDRAKDLEPDTLKGDRQTWLDWLAAHKDELSKLQPTGVGVDFSDTACKDGKPRKK